jgi:hypothetical protein
MTDFRLKIRRPTASAAHSIYLKIAGLRTISYLRMVNSIFDHRPLLGSSTIVFYLHPVQGSFLGKKEACQGEQRGSPKRGRRGHRSHQTWLRRRLFDVPPLTCMRSNLHEMPKTRTRRRWFGRATALIGGASTVSLSHGTESGCNSTIGGRGETPLRLGLSGAQLWTTPEWCVTQTMPEWSTSPGAPRPPRRPCAPARRRRRPLPTHQLCSISELSQNELFYRLWHLV